MIWNENQSSQAGEEQVRQNGKDKSMVRIIIVIRMFKR